jgi:hypothetical protein
MMKFQSRKLILLEANLDDMNPEWYAPVMEEFFEAGALDVTLTPILMKKTRPAVTLQVLSEPRLKEKLLEIFFRESTTLGVRCYDVERFELERKIVQMKTVYGNVKVKIGRDRSGKTLNASPEYESCRLLAKKKKVPIKKIYAAALKKL